MRKIFNILTSSGFIKLLGLLCICMTIFVTCIKSSADTLDLGDGVFQEVSPGEDINEGVEEEYVGSQDGSKDPAEGTQEPEEGTTEDYENSTQADQDSAEGTQEPEEGTTEAYENSTQPDQDPDQEDDQESNLQDQAEIDVLMDIDNSIKKLIISLWALFGLLLGTKLIKGLFGYGG